MQEPTVALQSAFSKNRTEELGYDVWKYFVVPPFYDRLDLLSARKPRVIIGGRGCGKTMLLRYLSHQSTFSPNRPNVPEEAVSHIGLYWRVDTQFAKVMAGRGLPDDTWTSAFDHLLAIVLSIQILKSLESMVSARILHGGDLQELHFDALSAYQEKFNTGYNGLLASLEEALVDLEMWVANVRKVPEPIFLPGRRFLLALIKVITGQILSLKEAIFFGYLDEFENLLEYQQELLNTCLKHSEAPLIFHLAMKRNGFVTTKTLGEESVTNIADYRTQDLEQYLLEGDFQLFAAEVLLLNLETAGLSLIPDARSLLRSPDLIPKRRDQRYRESILKLARSIFPGLTQDQLAKGVFEDDALRERLRKKIVQGLRQRNSTLPPELFLYSAFPQATIIVPALLNRRNLRPEDVAAELKLLEEGQDNRFTGRTNWIHNNFIGSFLALYESQPRPCPFYAGFDTFCQLARGNMRHFLELCHKSLNRIHVGSIESLTVPPPDQAQAARQASADFLGEIRSFGRLGNRLHAFVLRLGSLFALAQSRPSQSEPEQCHFSVTRGRAIADEDSQFLREAVKWSVLFEEEATKVKDEFQSANFEYILNPIYSPYFHISYRKRRRLEIASDELHVLIAGSYEEVKTLLRSYSKKWSVRLPDANPTLFSHLVEED